jgi:chemotaxis protein CheX
MQGTMTPGRKAQGRQEMRYEYLEAFVQSATLELADILKTEVRRGRVYYRSTAIPPTEFPAALRAAGDLAQDLVLDIEEGMALELADALGEPAESGKAGTEGPYAASIAFLEDRILARTRASLKDGMLAMGARPVRASVHRAVDTGLSRAALEIPLEMKGGKVVIDVRLRGVRQQ